MYTGLRSHKDFIFQFPEQYMYRGLRLTVCDSFILVPKVIQVLEFMFGS